MSESTVERSVSRGREGFAQSSGRGGIGNIRAASQSRDRPADGPDDFSSTRGREPAIQPTRMYSTGRGGAGNIRSPSGGERVAAPNPHELDVVREYEAKESAEIHSSGRGGLGNMSRSRSRGPAAIPTSPARHYSVGRGGVGNIQEGDGLESSLLDEEERRRALHNNVNKVHSTGRGGVANMTQSPNPGIETPQYQTREFESSGRGGSGNIRDRSQSQQRNASQEKHGISGLLHKVTHPRQS